MINDVTVLISRETAALTQAGFGMPLVLGTDGAVAYAECVDIAGVVEAGFASGTDVYKMAQAIFSQTPRPPLVAVAGVVKTVAQATATLTAASTASFSVTATAAGAYDGLVGNGWKVVLTDSESGGLAVALNASSKVITVDLGGADSTAAAIVTEIDGLTGFDAAVVNAGAVTIADDLGKTATLAGGTGGLSAALDALTEDHNNWYFLLCEDQDDVSIAELSAWTGTQKKLYFATTDNLLLASTLESDRTALVYHESDPTAAAGWVGKCAPELPGSITWKFKTISGLVASDIGVTALNALHDDGGNSYVRKLGILQTSEGLVTSGEYIDVMRSQDFIEARLVENVSRLLFTKKKVPYDNSGIALIVAECEGVMKLATNQGIIALDDDGNGLWSVTAPRREDIPTNDIANRKLDGVVAEATLAGAIHAATIRVTLKY